LGYVKKNDYKHTSHTNNGATRKTITLLEKRLLSGLLQEKKLCSASPQPSTYPHAPMYG